MKSYLRLLKRLTTEKGGEMEYINSKYLNLAIIIICSGLIFPGEVVYAKSFSRNGPASGSKSRSARSVIIDRTPPVVPSGLTGVVSARTVSLSWARNSDKDFKGYKIYRNGSLLGNANSPNYSDLAISQDGVYQYSVSAFDTYSNESAKSAVYNAVVDITPPQVPAGFSAVLRSFSQIDLSWDANPETDFKNYNIYRNGGLIASVTADVNKYSDISLASFGSFSYVITGVDTAGNESGKSSPVIVNISYSLMLSTTPATTPVSAPIAPALDPAPSPAPPSDVGILAPVVDQLVSLPADNATIASAPEAVTPPDTKLSPPSGNVLAPVLHAPVFIDSIIVQSVNENSPLNFSISAADADGGLLTYSVLNLPAGASFDMNTQVFSWTPTYKDSGSYTVTFSVTDGIYTANKDVLITVSNANRVPVFSRIGDTFVNEGVGLGLTLAATDPDGDNLTYSVSGLPAGAILTGNIFSWTSDYGQAGIYNVIFKAYDDKGGESLEAVAITVNNVNRSPRLNPIGNKSINEGQPLNFNLIAADPDGDALIYSAYGLPAGAALADNIFTWTPGYDQAGSYDVTFTVSDSSLYASEKINIIVNNVNRAPVLDVIGNKSVNENTSISFIVSATDPDANALIYSVAGLPSGATFTGNIFSWTPNYTQAGAYPVTFAVTDGSLNSFEAITVIVNDVLVNDAPFAINLKAEGKITPARGTNIFPALSWEFSGAPGKIQQGWEIQVKEWAPQDPLDPVGDGSFYLSGQVINPDPYYSYTSVTMNSWGTRVGSKSSRAAGRTHEYKWRIRVYDGNQWGNFSSWQTYFSDQAPSVASAISVDESGGLLSTSFMPAPNLTGITYYVKPSGNDAFDGKSPDSAVATINQALKLVWLAHGGTYNSSGNPNDMPISANGDTIVVYPGTYKELVIVLKSNVGCYMKSNALGKTLPKLTDLTIKGAVEGENQAIIDGAGLQGAEILYGGSVYVNSDNVTLENLTVKKAASGKGYIIIRGNNNKVLKTFTRPLVGGLGLYVTGNNLLAKENSIISQVGGSGGDSPLLMVNGYGIDVIGNEIYGSIGIKVARDSVGVHIIGNVIHGYGTMGGIYTYDGQHVLIAYNFIHDGDRAIMLYRTGHNYIFCNTIVNNKIGILLDDAWDSHLNSNIITGSTIAAIYLGMFGPAYRSYIDYNLLYGNKDGNNNSVNYRSDKGFPPPAAGHNILDQDPLFTDPANGDYSLQAGSPAIDAGDPDSPVPLGGGSLVDIGRYEYQAGNVIPYQFQPKFTISLLNPTIKWEFSDADNDIFGVGTDTQSSFQIQLDSVNTFDSPGIFTSGIIASDKSSVRIQNTLAVGKYYFRIRTTDNVNTGLFSAWSDPDMAFEIK